MMLDSVDKSTQRRCASSDPGWEKNNVDFLEKRNSEMSLFLVHLGIHPSKQLNSYLLFEAFYSSLCYVMVASSAPVQLPLSIHQVFIEHLFVKHSPWF